MNDRRTPNLEALDEHWVSQLVCEPRNVMEMPQSGGKNEAERNVGDA